MTSTTTAAETTNDGLSRQLQEWTQSSLANLYNLDRDPQVQALFTPDATITVNGDEISLEQYDAHIREQRVATTRIAVRWEDVLAFPDETVRRCLSVVRHRHC